MCGPGHATSTEGTLHDSANTPGQTFELGKCVRTSPPSYLEGGMGAQIAGALPLNTGFGEDSSIRKMGDSLWAKQDDHQFPLLPYGVWFPKIPSARIREPEGESGQHHMRCLPSSICLRCSSPICSNRGGSWKSRTSFFVTSSTSPSGVHRAVCGCVGATERCWYGCHGFGQACLGRPGSFSLTRYSGGIEQDFAPIGAGNLVLTQGGLRLAVSCANSSIG